MRFASVMTLLVFALPVNAQSDLPPEVLLLARVRHHAVADLSHLPNFTCLETIERSDRNSPMKPFDVKDVVRVEVAYVGGQELFAWPGASNFENRSLSDMIGSGMTSMGEFTSHARAVFLGPAVIHYVDQEESGGHRAARFNYEISPTFAGYTLNIAGRTGTVGVQGAFWADTTTFDLLRLTVEGTAIPDDLGIRALLTAIDYGRLRIGSADFLLPQSSSVWMGHDSGIENRNRIEFTHCRQYATESVLSFDEPSAAGGQKGATVGQVSEFTLPPGLIVSLRLEAPLNAATAKVGDAVSASLSSDLKHNGEVLAPKGAIVIGRVRVFQKRQGNGFLVGLEFTDLTFENKHARFLAKLLTVDSRFAHQQLTQVEREHSLSGGTTFVRTESPPDLPGVGMFYIPAGVAQLPKGLQMEWRMVGFAK